MIELVKTPIVPLREISNQGNHLYVKRDDLQPFSLGGNKVRIAQAFFQNMREKKADTMIIYGDARSNLCRVLANECEAQQIPCYMICTSVNHTGERMGNNAKIMGLFSAKVVPCEKNEIAKTVEDTMQKIEAAGGKPYYIYGNKYGTGNEGVAAMAYAKAYEEIIAFEQEQNLRFDYIFHASGTGATQTGLICGKLLHAHQAKIVGISISRDRERGTTIIKEGITSFFHTQEKACPENYEACIELEDAYNLGGYGIESEEIYALIEEELRINALPLDPTYTGKALLGMKKYIEAHNIKGKNILFLHTGGMPLFFDYMERKRG